MFNWRKPEDAKSSGDQSEVLYQELQKVKSMLAEVGKKRIELMEAPETQKVVLNLIVAQHLLDGSDPYILRLRAEVDEKKKILGQEERELTAKLKSISSELRNLTRPVIEKGIEKLGFELLGLKKKKTVLSRTSGGFSMIPKLEISTNEDGIREKQRLVRDARTTLQGMGNRPILEIENFVQETISAIRKIDLRPIQKEVGEFENERAEWLISPLTR